MTVVNRKFKDRLFIWLFNQEEHKADLLQLYNALNGTSYTDVDALEINTIEDIIYMGMKNDISCVIDGRMCLIEHQSSINPNMPLRGFMYFAKLYDKYIGEKSNQLYSTRLIKVPNPKYFVLYNGISETKDYQELRLSDAFFHKDDTKDFEWTATVLNINSGHNSELAEACQVLKIYVTFVAKIREYLSYGKSITEAVDLAVEYCINNDMLKKFLVAHKAEVIGVCLTEYDEERVLKGIAEELREDLREEVKAEVKAELKAEVKEELKEEVKAEVKEEVKEEVTEEVRTEVRTEYEQKLADKDAEIARQANELEAMRKLLAAQTKTTVNN